MRAHWLIETSVFPATAARITSALESLGYAWSRYQDGMSGASLPPADACVLFWGSLGSAYQDRVAARWNPGAVGAIEQFRCSAYHPHLRELLANGEMIFSTVADLVERPAAVLAPIGNPPRVFARPDSPLKPFSGRVLETTSLSLAALDHGFYYEDTHLPIVVSPARSVGREWRLVLADAQVVAGCEYGPERHGRGTEVPPAVQTLAEMVAASPWQPAALYIVDIGEVDGELRVMELNPFSGADLYLCDGAAVVEAASRVAERLHAAAGVRGRGA